MAHSYKFAIIRLEPNDVRGERLNIGALILRDERIDVRLTRRMERVRAISAAIDISTLKGLVGNFDGLDKQLRKEGPADSESRFKNLSRIGPLALSQVGTFVAESESAYEARVEALLTMLVEPEPAAKHLRSKKTKLLSEVKKIFRQERVLAGRDEGLESHRIVTSYSFDDGLVADLVLRNGAYHVIETVDASGDEHAFRRAVTEIAISALVLERARMRFGEKATIARLVFTASAALEKIAQPSLDAAEHQGTELINWASSDDRNRFVQKLSAMAIPIEKQGKTRFVSPIGGDLFH